MLNLTNKTVLITGGTGSFGKKLTRILLDEYDLKKVIVFSRDEMKQYEMSKVFQDKRIRFFIGDVRDTDRLHRALQGVDIIVHAAALKIVPTAEYNPFEAVQTNVIGAENIINMAIDNNVERVIALSTDKAANPINLYGATKLCSEKMFVAGNIYSPEGTKFSVVRYGNVVGSRGSVIPFFKECRKDGVVPVTDEKMTRFWITLEQGVRFVLQSLELMRGGEMFVPKIPSLKVLDLAKAVCPDCKIKIVGVRPGEKLHETLVAEDDRYTTLEYADQYIIYSKISKDNGRIDGGRPLGDDFKGYRSDLNTQWLGVDDLQNMISEETVNV